MTAPVQQAPQTAAAGDPWHVLDDALRRGVTVLTPTQRLARQCLRRFDAARQREGATAWQAPTILPWNAWIGSLWHDALVRGNDTRVLLNSLQERTLWKHAIAEETPPTPAHIRLCQSAVRLLGMYDANNRYHSQSRDNTGPNAQTFAAWYSRFEANCTSIGCLPSSSAEIELAEHMRQRRPLPSAEYILHGFDTLTPAQEHLIAALRNTGAQVHESRLAVRQQRPPEIMRCASLRDELRACAAWARQYLLDHPAANIAIVVPGLDATHPELERELRAAIAPECIDITRGEQQPPYEFSSGRPLGRLPVITGALRLLQWCTGDLPVEDAGALLRSPHLSLAPSPERGAELDTFVLRKATALRAELSLRAAARILRKHDEPTGERLLAIASAAESFLKRTATWAESADRAQELLHTANWPGSTELNSEEYQAIDRWTEALDRLSSLDLLGHRPTFSEAVTELAVIANDMLFAPENTAAPVQVVALSDAAGITADALWFLHADENTLLTHRTPHPFLPPDLQRDLAMPGTNKALDEDAAALGLHRLAQGTGQAIFSYAATAGDASQRLSPLLERLAAEWAATYSSSTTPPPPSAPTSFLETEEDTTPLPPLPSGTSHGGVGIIAAQAQCPFRAFAEHRLFASTPEKIEAGYSYRDRGDHVHHVLKAFWSEVKDHAHLVQLTNTTGPDGQSMRKTLLKQIVHDLYQPSAGNAWDEAYLSVQRQRLVNLLSAWLDVEAARPPFTVSATEKDIPAASLGPLTLRMRVDRIDTVQIGDTQSALLIDYKTGAAEPRDWFGERPDQPQLPVYAIAAGIENVGGIAFGSVRPRDKDRCLKGLSVPGKPLNLNQVEISLEAQLSHWREDLEALATGFAHGDTSVDPKEYPKTCDFCAQRMLCRVEESKPTEVDDDTTDDDPEVLEWR